MAVTLYFVICYHLEETLKFVFRFSLHNINVVYVVKNYWTLFLGVCRGPRLCMDSIVWIATLWWLSCMLLVEVEYGIMSLHTLFCRVWGMCMEVSVNLSQTLPLCSFASRFLFCFVFLFGLVVSLQSGKLH